MIRILAQFEFSVPMLRPYYFFICKQGDARMKIALVTPYDYPYPGGVTEHVRHLDREFRARGHDTRILAASSEPREALEGNVIKLSARIEPVPFNGSTARITLEPEAALRMQQVLRRERFDVVHIHEPAAPLLSLAALHYSSAINVGTYHAYSDHPFVYRYALPFMEWVYARLHGHIFVSSDLRDSLKSYMSKSGESRVIPNGIDYGRFAAPGIEPIAAFADGRPNILFVGRLDERKGFPHLLRAFARVKGVIPDARLLVVGAFDENDRARLDQDIHDYDFRDVQFIGRVSEEELVRYYRTATLFCAPSTGGESFGIVLLEAMASGLPVLASDIPGYRSVLHDGVEGYLTPPGEEESLASHLIALLRDPSRRKRMGVAGRSTAARFDWKVIAPRVLDYYGELIQTRLQPDSLDPELPRSRRSVSDLELNGVDAAVGAVMNVLLKLQGMSSAPRAPAPEVW